MTSRIARVSALVVGAETISRSRPTMPGWGSSAVALIVAAWARRAVNRASLGARALARSSASSLMFRTALVVTLFQSPGETRVYRQLISGGMRSLATRFPQGLAGLSTCRGGASATTRVAV